ncbi:MAG: hypothetical protein R3268_07675 [Acidiferrobacterales bacterium]|nr:hypothetical protein [Acidiferrobacterales bacterium]
MNDQPRYRVPESVAPPRLMSHEAWKMLQIMTEFVAGFERPSQV